MAVGQAFARNPSRIPDRLRRSVQCEIRYVGLFRRITNSAHLAHYSTTSAGCVYASWEEYGSCAGYDTIMGEVVKSSSSAFHGAAKKGTCDDEESRAISGEIDVDPEVAVVADKIADFIAAAQVECCEIRF